MTIQTLIDLLKKAKKFASPIQKHTLIVNEKSEEQGALFFITIGSKDYKVLIPAPFHSDVLTINCLPSHDKVLMHKEALLLK